MRLCFALFVLTSFAGYCLSDEKPFVSDFYNDPDVGDQKPQDLDSVLKYNPMPEIYYVEWNYLKYSFDSLKMYLQPYGVQFIENSPCCFRIENLQTAIRLEKKFMTSEYTIKLYPVKEYKPYSVEGWGGSCRYYQSHFEIYFANGTTTDWIESKLQYFGITAFSNSTRQQHVSYKVTFKSTIDRDYISALKKIWSLEEVTSIRQIMGKLPGLD